jgi:hypothetical protein
LEKGAEVNTNVKRALDTMQIVDRHDGGTTMVFCSGGRLKGINPNLPASLSGLTVETNDGSYHAVVHERLPELNGLYWRVHVTRFNGRTVNFVLPIEGYCLVDLFEETGRQLMKLAPQVA